MLKNLLKSKKGMTVVAVATVAALGAGGTFAWMFDIAGAALGGQFGRVQMAASFDLDDSRPLEPGLIYDLDGSIANIGTLDFLARFVLDVEVERAWNLNPNGTLAGLIDPEDREWATSDLVVVAEPDWDDYLIEGFFVDGEWMSPADWAAADFPEDDGFFSFLVDPDNFHADDENTVYFLYLDAGTGAIDLGFTVDAETNAAQFGNRYADARIRLANDVTAVQLNVAAIYDTFEVNWGDLQMLANELPGGRTLCPGRMEIQARLAAAVGQ